MKVMVMGCGRVGSQVAAALWGEGHQVVVLDTAPESFLMLPREMRETEGVAILGDGTLDEDLIRAGIESVDLFIAVSSRDNRNALAAQKAKQIFRVPRVVCRIGDPVRQEMYSQLGLMVVSPTKVTSGLILGTIRD
ncbi:MAG: TrkA family potassium uptake protein [Chloroflexi bacterium]|nr:TrkA family potassium uptake protein [Chloroflexota bacterium]